MCAATVEPREMRPAGAWYRDVTRDQWMAFVGSYFGWVLDGFDYTILTFLLVDVQRSFAVNAALAGLLGQITLMFRLVGGIGAGTAADRWGRKGPLMFSILWYSMFAFLSGFSTSYGMLFTCRALFGIGMGGVWAAGMPLTLEHWPARLRGLLGIPVEDRRPVRLAALQRVMHQVADHDRVLSARADVDAAMAGRVARRRREPERVVERKIVVDEQSLTGRDHRLAVEPPNIAAAPGARFTALGRFLPGGVFAPVEDVFRLREGRYPFAVAQHRVPAGVVDVQVRAENVVDVLEPQAFRRKTVEPRLFRKIHRRRIALVLARAGVDQDRVLARPQQPGMDRRPVCLPVSIGDWLNMDWRAS